MGVRNGAQKKPVLKTKEIVNTLGGLGNTFFADAMLNIHTSC